MNGTIKASCVAGALLLGPTGTSADVVQDWNAILITTVTPQNPFAQARFAAITHAAVFEAVNSITGDYRPYLGTITGPQGASPEAAAATAAHGVLRSYFPGNAATLDDALAASLATIPDGQGKTDGIVVGQAAAAAMIALRANDGSGSPIPYTPQSGPGYWQPTPPAFGPAILAHWGRVTPFGLVSGDQFRSEPPPALTSGKYAHDYEEVKLVGAVDSPERPQDRTDVARFFAVTTASRAWNAAANQLSDARGLTLSENARAFALLNMAINDGLIASCETKYFYQLWRPVTAIRAGDTDGNPKTEPDFGYTPLVGTPSFPSYPSAHASAGYAAREVLERVFGRHSHHIVLSNPAVPGIWFEYERLGDVTDDIDDARIYGGIHFRFDQEAGAQQGRRVGAYVFKNTLRPEGE